jgi:hypothetical protein
MDLEGFFVSLDFGGCYLVFGEMCIDYSEPSCLEVSIATGSGGMGLLLLMAIGFDEFCIYSS